MTSCEVDAEVLRPLRKHRCLGAVMQGPFATGNPPTQDLDDFHVDVGVQRNFVIQINPCRECMRDREAERKSMKLT